MSFEISSKNQQNRSYLYRLAEIFPRSVPLYARVIILVSTVFFFSGFGIVFDSLNGTFPASLELLRRLYVFNWLGCILFFSLSVYVSIKFYHVIYAWIDARQFIADSCAKDELKRKAKRALDIGFGPLPLVSFVAIYLLRRLAMSQMTPAPMEANSQLSGYAYWYMGSEILTIFLVLATFWSLLLFSGVLHYIASAFPIRVQDVAEYKDSFEGLAGLANTNTITTAFAVGFFFLGILYWAFSVGTAQYYVASAFLLAIAALGIALTSWLNLSGIQKGLDKTKKQRIASIRSGMQSSEMIDLQISLHSQVSIWKIGPKLLESLLFPMFVAELPILLQYVENFLRLMGLV